MAFIPAKCTQCGANIVVDSTHEAGICKFCGTPFITEKAINNYNTTVIQNNNFDGAIINVQSGNLENLIGMARNAIRAGNYAEAFDYANKILEIDYRNSEGWLIKGISVGWMSTPENLRLHECITYYNNALEYSANRDRTFNISANEYVRLSLAIIQKATDSFIESISETTYNTLNDTVNTVLKYAPNNNNNLKKQIAINIRNSVVDPFLSEANLYKITDDLSEYGRFAGEFIVKGKIVISVLQLSANLYEDAYIYATMARVTQEMALTLSYIGSKSLSYSISVKLVSCLSSDIRNGKKEFQNKIMMYHKKAKELDPNYVIPSTIKI